MRQSSAVVSIMSLDPSGMSSVDLILNGVQSTEVVL